MPNAFHTLARRTRTHAAPTARATIARLERAALAALAQLDATDPDLAQAIRDGAADAGIDGDAHLAEDAARSALDAQLDRAGRAREDAPISRTIRRARLAIARRTDAALAAHFAEEFAISAG